MELEQVHESHACLSGLVESSLFSVDFKKGSLKQELINLLKEVYTDFKVFKTFFDPTFLPQKGESPCLLAHSPDA